MKKLQKTLLSVCLIFVLVFGCALTAQAADTMKDPVLKSNTETSFTVGWDYYSGAAGYRLFYYTSKTSSSDLQYTDIYDGYTTSYTFKNIPKDTIYYVAVAAYDAEGQELADSKYFSTCVAKPGKISKVKAGNWTKKSVQLTLTSNPLPNTLTGVEYQILNTSGKVVKKGVFSSWPLTVSGLSAQKVYKYRVRAQVAIQGGKTYKGAWTTKWLIPQPTMNNLKLTNGKIKVSWKKVSGATKYILYASTSPTSGYKKLKALGSGSTSYTVSKVNGKKLQKYKNYYFKVVACKGSAKSDNSNYKGGYIYTVYK